MKRCDHTRPVFKTAPLDTGTHERSIWVQHGFLCERTNPGNHGQHGMEFTFLTREKATQRVGALLMMSSWSPTAVDGWREKRGIPSHIRQYDKPIGMLEIHSPKPLYDEHEPTDGCYLPEGTCYTDRAFSLGDEFVGTLRDEGAERMYERLEEWMVTL